jgi:iron complex outermembrane receptor protein
MTRYNLLDIGARYEKGLGSSLLTLTLNAYNLTDERYWASNGYVGDPRTLAFPASIDF